jgi:hypothetical protein
MRIRGTLKLLANEHICDDKNCKNNRGYSISGHKSEIYSSQIIGLDN